MAREFSSDAFRFSSPRTYRRKLGRQEQRIAEVAANLSAIQFVKVQYDFALNGGAIGTTSLSVKIPDNSLILYVAEEVLTNYDSAGDTGTIKLVIPTDGDLTNNQTADGTTPSADGIPNWAIANAVKTTAEREVSVTIATEALTAGKANFYIAYAVSE